MRHKNQLLVLTLLLSSIFLNGCIQQPIDETLFFNYNQTKLGQSSSGDVINYMDMSLTTLISQSDTVVASWGQSKKGYQEWLDVVAFDEQSADAVRKYFFFVDEKAHHIPFLYPKWTARFDGQLILDKEVLDKPYADRQLRSIAILKEIQKRFGEDIAKVSSDNKMLSICQMVVNESFETALLQLNETPAWATQLDTPEGWTFESRNFHTGTIHMHDADGIVSITIQLGSVSWIPAKSEPGRPYEPNAIPQ
jgi:hypothetical protein